ncbi:hypothetical protein QTI51_21175 [Variovorax sp. J22G73]|uniref:hypothetical protein n=1 Tax=unclassified Variovorax TaxID=663243 RepID=UPI0025790844|nr:MULTISPECIES: hypothetical protein [unclassified Variovorax]MDM0005784.1 hypothetical protein [Variovorax sp. J22R203]MDM0099811.1 hypothetical protein [Variovorax sp. J22G73]
MPHLEEATFATDRFDVLDAQGRSETVVEYTTYLTSSSATTHFRPIFAGVRYGLEDGTAVRRTGERRFEALGGRCMRAIERQGQRGQCQRARASHARCGAEGAGA